MDTSKLLDGWEAIRRFVKRYIEKEPTSEFEEVVFAALTLLLAYLIKVIMRVVKA